MGALGVHLEVSLWGTSQAEEGRARVWKGRWRIPSPGKMRQREEQNHRKVGLQRALQFKGRDGREGDDLGAEGAISG